MELPIACLQYQDKLAPADRPYMCNVPDPYELQSEVRPPGFPDLHHSTPSIESPMRAWAQQPTVVRATSRRRCVPWARAATVHEYTTHPNWAKLSWPRSDAAGSSVTLTTQCSLDRWPAVQRLLRSWDGQVSGCMPRALPLISSHMQQQGSLELVPG